MAARTRDDLHELIDRLPDSEIPRIAELLERLEAERDPLGKLLRDAPEDDEPLTEEDEAALREAEEQYRRGEYRTLDEVSRELER